MTEQAANRGRWQVWLMIAMLVVVIGAGFLLFPKTEEQRNKLLSSLGTTNHGEFVVPAVSMVDLELVSGDGLPWQFKNQKPKWRLVIAGAEACVDQCREMLYLTRQVHISLGKYSRRFERFFFLMGNEDFAKKELATETVEYIKLNHPFLTVLKVKEKGFAEVLKQTNAPLANFSTTNTSSGNGVMRAYLIDQKGLIMMSYTLDNKGSEMIEDIEHLMKYSPQ